MAGKDGAAARGASLDRKARQDRKAPEAKPARPGANAGVTLRLVQMGSADCSGSGCKIACNADEVIASAVCAADTPVPPIVQASSAQCGPATGMTPSAPGSNLRMTNREAAGDGGLRLHQCLCLARPLNGLSFSRSIRRIGVPGISNASRSELTR